MNPSPERLARVQGLFHGLDERTAIRMFQAFARFRETPESERDALTEQCCALMRQQKKKADEEAVRFKKLQAQLEKAENEIRQFLLELPDATFDKLFTGVELFRQLSAIEKHEAAAELSRFLESHKSGKTR
jgi:hypothetical protein